MGCIYRRAMDSSVSSAPKKVNTETSKASTPHPRQHGQHKDNHNDGDDKGNNIV